MLVENECFYHHDQESKCQSTSQEAAEGPQSVVTYIDFAHANESYLSQNKMNVENTINTENTINVEDKTECRCKGIDKHIVP